MPALDPIAWIDGTASSRNTYCHPNREPFPGTCGRARTATRRRHDGFRVCAVKLSGMSDLLVQWRDQANR